LTWIRTIGEPRCSIGAEETLAVDERLVVAGAEFVSPA
jgi:hypothetical protein